MFKRGCLFLGLLLPVLAGAQDLRASDAYARATPPGAPTGAAFFQLDNHDQEPRTLVAVEVSSAVAERGEIHDHVSERGMMRMRQVARLSLAPGERLRFEPGGLHIMLLGLKQPLTAGERFELTLRFDNGERLRLQVPVRDMRAGRSNMPHPGEHGMQREGEHRQ